MFQCTHNPNPNSIFLLQKNHQEDLVLRQEQLQNVQTVTLNVQLNLVVINVDVQQDTMTMIWIIVMLEEPVPQVSYIKVKLYNPQFVMNGVVICK